jgi:hypothetical protein
LGHMAKIDVILGFVAGNADLEGRKELLDA